MIGGGAMCLPLSILISPAGTISYFLTLSPPPSSLIKFREFIFGENFYKYHEAQSEESNLRRHLRNTEQRNAARLVAFLTGDYVSGII